LRARFGPVFGGLPASWIVRERITMVNHMTKQLSEKFKKAYSIPEVCALCSLGRSSVYAALSSGKLTAVKHGRRTVIFSDAVDTWLASLPPAVFIAPNKDGV
jgi:excisionase family DNA binding protein